MAGIAPQKSGPVPQELELPGGKTGFRNWLDRNAWRDIIIAVPYVWLVLFFVVPFFIIVAMSLAYSVIAQPPAIASTIAIGRSRPNFHASPTPSIGKMAR